MSDDAETERGAAASQVAAPPTRRRATIVFALTVVICVAAVWGVLYMKQVVKTHGGMRAIFLSPWALPGLFLANVLSCATLFMPVPGLLLSASAGNFYAGWLVGLVAGSGQTVGEITGYMAGYSGRTIVGRRRAYERAQDWLRRNERVGAGFLFVMAAIPSPLFDASGMAAGVLRFPLWKFLASVGLGKIVKNTVVAYLGQTLIAWLTPILAVSVPV